MSHPTFRLLCGDAIEQLRTLDDESVQCCVTSPPYWNLRDYGTATWEDGDPHCDHLGPPKASTKSTLKNDGRPINRVGQNEYERRATVPYRVKCAKCGAQRIDKQIGVESTPEEFISRLVEVFREVRRTLRADATCWIVLGDSYAGSWGNQGRTPERGTQRPINGPMLNRVHDGRYPAKDSGTGTCPLGLKPKDLVGIPWSVALALRADGWYLRSDIIWAKPGAMPESVTDRPTKSHEYLFLLSKAPTYYYDAAAIAEPCADSTVTDARIGTTRTRDYQLAALSYGEGTSASRRCATNAVGDGVSRNKRSVWTINTQNFPGAHFATMPEALVEPCIAAGSKPGDTILDPFGGSMTVVAVALRMGRSAIGIDLNPEYIKIGRERIEPYTSPLFEGLESS